MRRFLLPVAAAFLVVSGCATQQATTGTTSGPATTAGAEPGMETTTSSTTTIVTPETALQAGLPWWNDRVFYEVFIRSFADSDGDGIGDLRGAIERLDYLNDGDPATTADLGVTGIWLMPVFASPSYHGYDVVDYRVVEEDYGSFEDLKEFVAAAQDRGIAVIVDLVVNHTSVKHPWFVASAAGDPEYADWYLWSETRPTYAGPWGQTVWHRRGDRYYYGLFWEGMPDLNLENPAVTAEMHDIARFWIEEVGVDGYRIDAAKHFIEDGERQENTTETLDWLRDFRSALPEGILIVGEVWSPTQVAARYVPDSLDLVFEFDLAFATVQGVNGGDARLIGDTLMRVASSYPPGQFAVFLTNHDQERVMSQLGSSREKAQLAATLLLTYPGVPFVYYGEEVGMTGRKPDPRLRTPMPWTGDLPGLGFTDGVPWERPQPGFETANVASQISDPGSLLSRYRDLIRVRSESPALRYGDIYVLETGSRQVLGYLRSIGDDHVLVVANLGALEDSGYVLSMPAGPLPMSPGVEVLIGPGGVVAPVVDDVGGFSGYRPLPVLPPRTSLVIRLPAAAGA